MGLFVSSTASIRRHGINGLFRRPPTVIAPVGNGVAAIVAQFAWGPDQVLTTPADTSDFLDKFAPDGMSHLTTGYLAVIGKAFPTLKVVRVLASGKAKAVATLTTSGPTTQLDLTLKYNGTAGNSCIATVSDASDGNANHCNITVSVTDARGTTSDVLVNVDNTATTFVSPDLSTCKLLGTIARHSTNVLRPLNGTYTFSGGLDGTITSAEYVGTPGSGNMGLALLETDKSISAVFTDDCGDALRSAVNTGLLAHAIYCGDRMAFLQGPKSQTVTTAKSDKAGFTASRWGYYCGQWGYVYDDVTGAQQYSPLASFAASVACQLSPSTGIAWKSSEVGDMLVNLIGVDMDWGQGVSDAEDAGILAAEMEESGGYRFEADCTMATPADPTLKLGTDTRMAIYIAASFARANRSYCDGPNVPFEQLGIVGGLQTFMDDLKKASENDPEHKPFVLDYSIDPLESVNTRSSLANGFFYIPLNYQTGPQMSHIVLSIQGGVGVTIRTA